APTETPTGGNVPPPVNVGTSGQTKYGSLGVTGLISSGRVTGSELCLSSDCRTSWPTGGAGGGSTWGSITGILSSQRDLQDALNLKASSVSPVFTGTPSLPSGTIAVTQTAGTNNTTLATTQFVQNAVGAGGSSQWTTSGNNIFNNNSGRVGIGTTVPYAKLEVIANNVEAGIRVRGIGVGISASATPRSGNPGVYSSAVGGWFVGGAKPGMSFMNNGILFAAGETPSYVTSGDYGMQQTDLSPNLIRGKTIIGREPSGEPRAYLDVIGDIRFSGPLLPNGSAGTAGQVLTSAGPGTVPVWQAPTSGSSQWTTSGNNIFNNNSGRVGIGTTVPYAKLEVIANNVEAGIRVRGIGVGISASATPRSGNPGVYSSAVGGWFVGGAKPGMSFMNNGILFAAGETPSYVTSGDYGMQQTDLSPNLIRGKTIIGREPSGEPRAYLDVIGDIRFSGPLLPNGSAGIAGQVLTSAGSSAAPTWQTP
ncbi:MAG: hypothetical protein AAB657_02645, partial [Patescibacteria group bacterium]